MKCTVHGDGLYAWATAARLAEAGHEVALVTDLAEPETEIRREPRLLALIQEQEAQGRLRLLHQADGCDAVQWIAHEGGSEAIETRTRQLLLAATSSLTFVVLVTTPVGFLDALQRRLKALRPQLSVTVLALPLFVRNGRVLSDFAAPSLFLIGEPEPGAGAILADWLRPYSRQAADTMTVPLAAAELIKFSVNAMLATRISFMNELAGLTERMGIDIDLVRQGMAADPRVGAAYLEPGCGFGGPSFTDELFDFAGTLREAGGQPGLLDAVLRINAEQRDKPFRMLWQHYAGRLTGRRIAVWGAAYKAGTASIDHSPIHPLLAALWAQGAEVVVHDPMAGETLRAAYPDERGLQLADTALAAAADADALILLTAWPEFHNPDYAELHAAMRAPVIIDGRNVFDPLVLQHSGFAYYGIGRGHAR